MPLLPRILHLPPSLWARVEDFAARRQGKGYGAATCDWEIAVCAHLLGSEPRVVLDVGANIGSYAEAIARRFPRAAVHSFEPSSAARARLAERLRPFANITIHACAVSDSRTTAELWSDAAGSALASLSKRELGHFGIEMRHHESVPVERLDAIWPQFGGGPVDWIKLDVEGHELAALRGLGERMRDTRLIQFEFGGCNIDTRTNWRDFWTLFHDAGWTLHRITPSGPQRLKRYREIDEHFRTTNFVAVHAGAGS